MSSIELERFVAAQTIERRISGQNSDCYIFVWKNRPMTIVWDIFVQELTAIYTFDTLDEEDLNFFRELISKYY